VKLREIKYVPLDITVRNKVPSENILAGTLFLTVISKGNLGNHIFSAGKKDSQ
jgi:hypothetical protein